jgi:hypothetical protein
MGERERAPGAAVGSADRGVGMALSGTVGGGSMRSQQRWAGKHGRAAGCGRRRAARLTGGAEWQRGPMVNGGVREEERKARQCGGGAPTGGPGPHSVGARFEHDFKPIQKYSIGSNEI